ncbi:hypothetical protein LWI29_022257 [Acer saccharum]|uniref:PB1-like domain-containing protein n=1 Tax=Acer saccharum TaxID=4024 RepID=A0AA39T5M7_ACESA|nr:hypothetical protein LWI29_022257 [Acer saccharum]
MRRVRSIILEELIVRRDGVAALAMMTMRRRVDVACMFVMMMGSLDPNDLENYFSFRVHHGGEFDSKMVNYIGGSECFYDYVTLDELFMLDIEDIAKEMGYNLPMVYYIQLLGYGKPFILDSDKDLMWFHDRIPVNRVVDLYIQHVLPLNVVTGKELVCDGRDDMVYDGPDEVGIGLLDKGVFDGHAEVGIGMPSEGVFDGHDEVGTSMPGERVFDGHDEARTGMLGKGVCVGPDEIGNGRLDEGVCDGLDDVGNGRPDDGVYDRPNEVDDLPNEGGNGTSRVTERAADKPDERAAAEENDELVETDYEQE